ncbi:MAG: hypothetical protein ACRDRS_22275 [Pseudonocardiaceae bacterium]
MTGFFSELGTKLADRWIALLVLPGVLYVATATAATVLGHRHALDVGELRSWVDAVATVPATHSTGTVLLVATGVLVAATGAGLIAATLGFFLDRAWNTPGTRVPGRWLTNRRRRRWNRAEDTVNKAIAIAAQNSAVPYPPLREALVARNRISLLEPDRPTWIGDRLRATDHRLHHAYDLDLATVWPRLWLLIPDSVRAELSVAQDAYTATARLSGWGMLYLIPGCWWWPALGIATTTVATAWIRARLATVVLADLTESTVELYTRDLATQLGLPVHGPLTKEVGLAITATLRKDPAATDVDHHRSIHHINPPDSNLQRPQS